MKFLGCRGDTLVEVKFNLDGDQGVTWGQIQIFQLVHLYAIIGDFDDLMQAILSRIEEVHRLDWKHDTRLESSNSLVIHPSVYSLHLDYFEHFEEAQDDSHGAERL